MAWSTPITAVSNAALTAAQWNASVRDNLLETAPAKATTAGSIFVATGANAIAERIPTAAFQSASETTASTTYVDLTTAGPSVTVTTGPTALALYSCTMSIATINATAYAAVDITGATTSVASDIRAQKHTSATVGAGMSAIQAALFSLTPGSNTFKLQYRVSAGTGTFNDRRVTVIPL